MIAIILLQLFIGTTKTIFTMRTGQQIDARLILGYYKPVSYTHLDVYKRQTLPKEQSNVLGMRFKELLRLQKDAKYVINALERGVENGALQTGLYACLLYTSRCV